MAEMWRWNLQLFAGESEKTEDPTAKRRADARKDGQVNKSIEIGNAVGILGMMFLFLLLSRYVFGSFQALFVDYWGRLVHQPLGAAEVPVIAREIMYSFFRMSLPVLLVSLFLGLASSVAQVGFLFTVKPLQPKLEKMDPIKGAKRVFSRKALFDLIKSIFKIVIIGAVTYLFIRSRFNQMLVLINQDPAIGARFFWETMVWCGLVVGLVYIVLAAIDFIYQRFEHEKELKMSRQEIKDERKQMEGDPLVRSHIRRKQMELTRRRMLQEVPTADVVITNPFHIAVALKYKEGETIAPVLIAKGINFLAQRIKEIAEEHRIPIVENQAVARIIWKQTEVGEEIPLDMYQAVAEILAMVYRMKDERAG